MSILERLSQNPTSPSYVDVLGKLNRAAVANELGITASYWCSILTGWRTPSEMLEAKIQKLADMVLAEAETELPGEGI